jgi:hypothetical protein
MEELWKLIDPDCLSLITSEIEAHPASTWLTLAGLVLFLLTMALVRAKMARAAGGFALVALLTVLGGQGLAVYGKAQAMRHIAWSPMEPAQAFERLKINTRTDWLIRLIAYDPRAADQRLSAGRISHLGTAGQRYVFVADYTELRGYTAAQAVYKTGGSLRPGQHVTAIIFRVGDQDLYPANARGLLQVVRRVDSELGGSIPGYRPFSMDGLSKAARKNLADLDITSWSWAKYAKFYPEFSQEAELFKTGDASAASFIGSMAQDWSDLGYSRIVGAPGPQQIPPAFRLTAADGSKIPVTEFGARAFLIPNAEIAELPGRTLIEFDAPERQVIPDLWEIDPATRQVALR